MTLLKDILWAFRDRWYQLRDSRKNYRTTDAGAVGVTTTVEIVAALIIVLLLLGSL